MILKNTYITEFESVGKIWAGQVILAKSWREAQNILDQQGLEYLTIVGELKFSFYVYEFN